MASRDAADAVATPPPESTAGPTVGNGQSGAWSAGRWQKGFAFWDRTAPLGSPESLESLRYLRVTGADTVSPVVTWYVAHPWDFRLHRGRKTAADQELVATIDEAHKVGLQVVLTLHVDCEDGQWRARINPDDKERWFAAYRAMLNHYAELAEVHHVEGLVVGAELASLTGPAYTEQWQAMIADVRQRFSGFLTYSAQWGSAPPETLSDQYREFEHIGFWRDLDYLGISAYFELAGDGHPQPAIPELLAQWERWMWLRVVPFQARYAMPLLFTEVGYASTNGSARHPWDVGTHSGSNPALQASLYSALFEVWAQIPWFRGAYFWFWPTDVLAESGPTNLDYPPTGKPAEQVVRRWFTRLDDMERSSLHTPGAGGTIPPMEGR